jgi:hypothetical protein
MKDRRSTDQALETDRRIVTLDAPGPITTTDPTRKPARFTLDFATWRARIATPGSRFEPVQPASPRIVRLDALSREAVSSEGERRMA